MGEGKFGDFLGDWEGGEVMFAELCKRKIRKTMKMVLFDSCSKDQFCNQFIYFELENCYTNSFF